MKKLCIYHGGACLDGFTAAWVFNRFCRQAGVEVEFLPAQYGDKPPSVIGRDVVILDFSYPREVVEEMMATATSLTLLDHHKSAMAALQNLNVRENSIVEFDMERSGAGMAWDNFFDGLPRPALVNFVEDRDLWRFRHQFTRAVNANLASLPFDFEQWDRVSDALENNVEGTFIVCTEGNAILRKHDKDVRDVIRATQRRMRIGGIFVPVANVPPGMISDAGNIMAQGEPFAACYFDTQHARKFSLRSDSEGNDVSAVAALYGGGGHAKAAGFSMPLGWEGETHDA